jgi:hypothetical protein
VFSPAVPWQRLLTVEILQLHELKSCLHRLPYRNDLVDTIVFKITPWHGPRRNIPVSNNTSTAARGFVAAGTCLPNRCLETALVYSPISRSRHSNGSTRYSIIAISFINCKRILKMNALSDFTRILVTRRTSDDGSLRTQTCYVVERKKCRFNRMYLLNKRE